MAIFTGKNAMAWFGGVKVSVKEWWFTTPDVKPLPPTPMNPETNRPLSTQGLADLLKVVSDFLEEKSGPGVKTIREIAERFDAGCVLMPTAGPATYGEDTPKGVPIYLAADGKYYRTAIDENDVTNPITVAAMTKRMDEWMGKTFGPHDGHVD